MHRQAILLTAFFGGAFFTTVALFKIDPDDFIALDTLAFRVVASVQSLTPSEFFIGVTTLGSRVAIGLVFLLVAFFLRSQKLLVARLTMALMASSLSVYVGKLSIERIRPESLPWLTQLHSFSFPSGHTALATVLYGFIGLIVLYRVSKKGMRFVLLGAVTVVIVGVGLSRIVLAAHYGSDVLAGFFLGGFSLSLAFCYPLTPSEKKYLQRGP